LYYFLRKGGLSEKEIMENYDIDHFNEQMRVRTKVFAINVYKMMNAIRLNDLSRIPAKQLLRSSSSVAANFRSATRGRSEAEFYSKICIVVEECDESVFWLEFLSDTGILTKIQTEIPHKEADELLRIFSTIKKKLRNKRDIK
jgi:four helix bundle protein